VSSIMFQEETERETMFFRLLFLSLIGYFIYKYFKGLFIKDVQKDEVKGQQKSKPIDFKNEDVQDAEYEDIK